MLAASAGFRVSARAPCTTPAGRAHPGSNRCRDASCSHTFSSTGLVCENLRSASPRSLRNSSSDLGPARETDDGGTFRQEAVLREVIKRGNDLAMRQVPGGAEDHRRDGLQFRRRGGEASAGIRGCGWRWTWWWSSSFLTRCRSSTRWCRPGPSSSCGRTGRAACRHARRCGRRSSRAGPGAGSRAGARSGTNRRTKARC